MSPAKRADMHVVVDWNAHEGFRIAVDSAPFPSGRHDLAQHATLLVELSLRADGRRTQLPVVAAGFADALRGFRIWKTSEKCRNYAVWFQRTADELLVSGILEDATFHPRTGQKAWRLSERVASIVVTDAAQHAVSALPRWAPPTRPDPNQSSGALMGDGGVQTFLRATASQVRRAHVDGAIEVLAAERHWLEDDISQLLGGELQRPHFQPWIASWLGSLPEGVDRGENWTKYFITRLVRPPTSDHRERGPHFEIGTSDWHHIQGQRFANGMEPQMLGRRFSQTGEFVGTRGTRFGLEFNAVGTDPCSDVAPNERVLYATCSHIVVESNDPPDGRLILVRRSIPQRGADADPVAFAAGAWSVTIEEQPSSKDLCQPDKPGSGPSLFFNAALRGLGEELLDTRDLSTIRRETSALGLLSVFFEPAPWFINLFFAARLALSAEEIATRWALARIDPAESISMTWASPSEALLRRMLRQVDFDPTEHPEFRDNIWSRGALKSNRGLWHPSARYRLWRYAQYKGYSVPRPALGLP